MRPKHLPLPEESTIRIHDNVWYIPNNANTELFQFPGWSSIFNNNKPVHVEYCSGNGLWILQKAIQEPHINWVAVEMKFSRVRKIWSKIKNYSLKNLLVIHGEALQATQSFFPTNSLSGIYVNFPDPWPKRRHWKFRLVAPEFVRAIANCLQPEGKATLVTDHEEYSNVMIREFLDCEHFDSEFSPSHYSLHWPDYGTSYFEELWRNQGGSIRYHVFRKR